jgi:hypothetical protein
LQTFPKLLLLLVPKVTTRSLYPEYIANLKLPIDAFYRESRSGLNIAKRNITTGLFGLGCCPPFSVDIQKLVLFTHAHTGRLPTMIPDTTWQLIIHVFTFSFEIYRCQALTY